MYAHMEQWLEIGESGLSSHPGRRWMTSWNTLKDRKEHSFDVAGYDKQVTETELVSVPCST